MTAWRRFLFGPRDVRPLALLRISVGFVVAWMLLERIPVARAALSDDGWLTTEASKQLMDSLHLSLFFVFDSPAAVAGTLAIGALCAGLFMLGLFTRVAGIVAFVVLTSAHVRNPAVLYGADSVARIWLFYLLLMPCGRAWSIDAIRGRLRTGASAFGGPTPVMEAWPTRLLQIQIAVIYLATGVSKAYGTDYHDGSALWFALANPTYSRFYPLLEPLFAKVTPLLAVLTNITLWWEVAFAFALPFTLSRRVALGIGLFVHGGIFVLLEIQFWGPLMMLSYLAFLSGRPLHGAWLRHVRETRDRRWSQRVVYVFDPTDAAQSAVARRLAALDAFGLIRREEGDGPAWLRASNREVIPEGERTASIRALLPWAARPFWREA